MNMQQKRKRVQERIDLRWSAVIIVIALLVMAMCTSCSSKSGQVKPIDVNPAITGQAFIDDLNSFDSSAVLVSKSFSNDDVYGFIIEQNDSLFTYRVKTDQFAQSMYSVLIEGRAIK